MGRNREAFNVNEQFEHELEVDNQPSPKKAKIKEEFLEENEAKDFKIAHLEKEVEELKKKLEESKLEVDPQIKTQIENSIIIEERKKLDKQRAKFEEKETHLINQNALIQKLYQEKKEENERLLESDGEKGALTDLLPKNEIDEIAANRVLQTIFSKDGQRAGKFIYESHRTNSWKNEFIDNLKSQQTKFEADHAILVTTKLPGDLKNGNFDLRNGVWICKFQDLPRLEKVLRHFMLKIHNIKKSEGDSNQKSLLLYDFIKSDEFKSLTEYALEKSGKMLKELKLEEKYVAKNFASRRKQIAEIENAINELTDTIVEKMADDAVNERTNSNGNMPNINPNEDDEESGILVY